MQPGRPDVDNTSSDSIPVLPSYYYGQNGEPLAGFGRGVGLRFVEYYFPKATTSICIASSYFSLEGYEAARPYILSEVRLDIVIGREQTREAKRSIGYEILEELGRAAEPLYEAVKDLLERIQQGRFTIQSVGELQTSKRRPRFHCKFILCDEGLMLSGSANFTRSGLRLYGNEEQLVCSQDIGTLQAARKFFNDGMSHARDLLLEVRLCLEEWLDMATPFQAYLKTLDCLFSKPQPPLGPEGLVPTYFQESVIAGAANSLLKYDGCLLLVGTGLGKTVIGAESIRRIKTPPFSGKVIVLAPINLASSWEKQLRSRLIRYDFFDISLLFRAPGPEDKEHAISRLETALAECSAETVILVDEAHKYRGVLQKEAAQKRRNALIPLQEQHPYRLRERFAAAIERKARILLLTATPFGTSKQDLNSLLSLLPPVAHTTADSSSAWSIKKLRDTAALPPVTVLGMHDVLHMASERGDTEADGRLYIAMPDGRHLYLPKQIESHRVEFTLPLSQEFAEAFEEKAFRGKNIAYDRFDDEKDKNLTGIANATENNAVTAWLSSPGDLRRVVKDYRELRTSDHKADSATIPSDNSKRKKSGTTQLPEWEERRRLLQPLWEALQQYQAKDDNKLAQLVKLLQQHIAANNKVIIFVRRYATAYYLEKQLKLLLPSLSIGSTVREQNQKGELKSVGSIGSTVPEQNDTGELKTSGARQRIIQDFAPKANPSRRSKTVSPSVLICTDADGIGLNMQDANVVIHYDLPLSADLLFQRVGRIIRMTDEPERIVIVYTFLPEYSAGSHRLEQALCNLKNTMVDRHDKSAIIVGGSILPADNDPLVIPMACKTDIDRLVKQFPMPEDSLTESPLSPDSHYAIYDRHKDKMAQLPFTLLSAKNYGGAQTHVHVKDYRETEPHIVVCLQWQETSRCILYNVERKEIVYGDGSERGQALLDLLKCEAAEPKAYVSAKEVENAAIAATEAWLSTQHSQNEPEENEEADQSSLLRVCAVYLQPKSKGETSLPDIFIGKTSPQT